MVSINNFMSEFFKPFIIILHLKHIIPVFFPGFGQELTGFCLLKINKKEENTYN